MVTLMYLYCSQTPLPKLKMFVFPLFLQVLRCYPHYSCLGDRMGILTIRKMEY